MARGTKIRDDMPKEGVTHRVCSLIASRDKDSVPGVAIYKHDEELMSVIGGERGPQCPLRAYPMDPGTVWCLSFSNDAHNLSQLTPWAALGNLYAEAATGFVCIPVTEEFPQCLAT